jgi:hypothetical protein
LTKIMNDSKRLIIPVAMPPAVIGAMKMTDKYCMRTEGNNYVYFILEKLTYDAKVDEDIILGKIYARTIGYQIITPASISSPAAVVNPDGAGFPFKAYFDPIAQNINSLELNFYIANTDTFMFTASIDLPTNFKGAGGLSVLFNPDDFAAQYEVRVTQGTPKFLQYLGIQIAFTSEAGYYKAIFQAQEYMAGLLDYWWISF